MTTLFGLDLSGRRVVVAGAGAVATRRVRRFLTAGADVRVVAPTASDDIQRQASHGDLTWQPRPVEPSDLDDAWLVLAATDDPGLNDRIAEWAEERRVWCIDASDASRGTARQAAKAEGAALALMESGVARPRWADRVGVVKPAGCYVSRDAYGDQDTVVCTFAYHGKDPDDDPVLIPVD